MTKTRRGNDERLLDGAAEPFAVPEQVSIDQEHALMKFGIRHDGLRYLYNGYRYDRLADAVAYATLMRSKAQPDPGGPFRSYSLFAPPTEAQRALMATLAIDFDGRAYRFKGFRYDVLSDAVNYAKLMLDRGHTSQPRAPDGAKASPVR
ncbi:MAG TPA: hypothetical protein VFU71_11365 [Burkholderiaceae bacterium]|nr:hypothetical protein [Burkholderiaceae bacterium]